MAFLSYASADVRVARWLHQALERYRVPSALAGTASPDGPIPTRVGPIFRDRDELRTGGHLDGELVSMLRRSRHLIVVCSPDAARSHWVDQEIRHFREQRPEGLIHPLIARGEPNSGDPATECLPPALRSLTSNVIAADLREGGDGRDAAFLKIVSGLLRVDLGVLRNRDEEAKRRRLRTWLAASIGLAAVFAAIALYANKQRIEAVAQAEEAARQRDRSLAVQSRLMADVADQRTIRHDEGTALAIALEALPSAARGRRRPYVPEAEVALYSALVGLREEAALRHAGPVTSFAMSRDGRLLLATAGCSVCLWDLSTRRVRLAFDASANPLSMGDARACPARTPGEQCPWTASDLAGAALSENGKLFAMATNDERIVVLDSETGSVVRDLSPGGIAAGLAFAPSDSRLASLVKSKAPGDNYYHGPSFVRLDDVDTGAFRAYEGSACGRAEQPEIVQWIAHGARLAASGNGSTCVWDPDGVGRDRPRIVGIGRYAGTPIVFSDDAARALWFPDFEAPEVRVRSINSNADFARSPAHGNTQGRIVDAALSGDGQRVLEGFADGSIRVWDVAKQAAKVLHGGATGELESVAFSPDGTLAAALTNDDADTAEVEDGAVSVWSVATGTVRAILAGPRERVTSFAFSSDSQRLATSADTGAVRLYTLGQPLPSYRTFSGHEAIARVQLSPDGARLVTTEWGDGGVKLFSVQDATEIPLPNGIRGAEEAVPSPDWSTVALRMGDGTVALLSMPSLATLRLPHPSYVHDVRFNRAGTRLLTSCNDGQVRLWNALDGTLLETYSGHRGIVWEALFSPTEDRVVTRTDNGESRLYQTGLSSLGTVVATRGVAAVSWSLPDGALLATGGMESNEVCLWTGAGVQRRCIPGHLGGVRSLAWNRDGRLAIGGQQGSIWILDSVDAPTGRLVFDDPNDEGVMGLAWSPDGRWLISLTVGAVRVHEPTSGDVTVETAGHDMTSLAFSPDGRRVAFVSGNDTTEILDLSLERPVMKLRASTDSTPPDWQDAPAPSVAFSADGNWLASAHAVTTARVSRIWKDTAALVDEACRLQPFVLSSDERMEFLGDGGAPIDPCESSADSGP